MHVETAPAPGCFPIGPLFRSRFVVFLVRQELAWGARYET